MIYIDIIDIMFHMEYDIPIYSIDIHGLIHQESGVPAWVVDVDGLEGGFSVGILQQAEVLTQEETERRNGRSAWG